MKRIFITVMMLFMAMLTFAQNYNNDWVDSSAPENTVKIPGHEIYVKGMDEGFYAFIHHDRADPESWKIAEIGD